MSVDDVLKLEVDLNRWMVASYERTVYVLKKRRVWSPEALTLFNDIHFNLPLRIM